MKRTLLALFCISGFLSFSFLEAQQGGIGQGFGANGFLAGSITPGDYNFKQLDPTVIQQIGAQEHFKRNEADYQYFLKKTAEVRDAIDAWRTKHLSNTECGLKWLSDNSLGTDGVQALPGGEGEGCSIIEAVNDFNDGERRIRNMILTVTAITQGMTPTATEIKFAGEEIDIDSYGSLNFDPLVAQWESMLGEARLSVSYLPFGKRNYTVSTSFDRVNFPKPEWVYVKDENGEFVTNDQGTRFLAEGPALSLDFDKMRLPFEVLQKMGQDIAMLRRGEDPDLVRRMEAIADKKARGEALTAAERDTFNNADPEYYQNSAREFTRYAMNEILDEVLDVFGFSERYRSQGKFDGNPRNEGQLRQRNEWLNTAAEVMFYRSLFRYQYKFPLGTKLFVYDKKIFNLDVISSVQSMIREGFTSKISYEFADLMSHRQSVRLALLRLDRRATRLTAGGRAVTDGEAEDLLITTDPSTAELVAYEDTGVLSKLEYIKTWLGGNTALADVGLFVFQMLAADAYEEQLVMEGRYDELETLFFDRFFPEFEEAEEGRVPSEAVQKAMRTNNFYAGLFDKYENWANDPTLFVTDSSPLGKLVSAMQAAQLVEELLDRAEDLDVQYKLAIRAGKTKASQRREDANSKIRDRIKRRRP